MEREREERDTAHPCDRDLGKLEGCRSRAQLEIGLGGKEGQDRAEVGLAASGESSSLLVASETLTGREAAAPSFEEGEKFGAVITGLAAALGVRAGTPGCRREPAPLGLGFPLLGATQVKAGAGSISGPSGASDLV